MTKRDDEVYPPSEDTFLLLDALGEDCGRALEIGCGSGAVTLELAQLGWDVVATDLNAEAVCATKRLLQENQVTGQVDLLVGDLLSPFRDALRFDLLVFNAPYVPHEEPAQFVSDLAWHGGGSGRLVISRMLSQLLVSGLIVNRCLLVQSTLSDVESTLEFLRHAGYETTIAQSKPAFFEKILVIEASNPRVAISTKVATSSRGQLSVF